MDQNVYDLLEILRIIKEILVIGILCHKLKQQPK